jgi:hypothetical protein
VQAEFGMTYICIVCEEFAPARRIAAQSPDAAHEEYLPEGPVALQQVEGRRSLVHTYDQVGGSSESVDSDVAVIADRSAPIPTVTTFAPPVSCRIAARSGCGPVRTL